MIHGENIIYLRIDWENYPSDKTPVNERNLNKMDLAIHLLDERVVWLNENKFDKSESFKLVKNIDLDESTGIFTITYYDNTTKKIDTILEKIATNWDYDEVSQQLIITLDDGTVKRVDLSALITQYEFMTSDTISVEVQSDGKVKFMVREGSIQEKHLRPDYLAEIKIEQGKAQSSAEKSEEFAKLSESYAHGGTGTRPDEDADNAMAYAEKAKEYSNDWKGSLLPQGTIRFSQLPTSGNVAGHMYNINESFTTDSRFEEGAGYSYPAGTNIYWNSHSKWDCLSGALTKFLTQEEYDALPQSVQKNGTMYFVQNSDTETNPGESEYTGRIYVNGVDFSASVITRGVAGIKGENNEAYKTGYVNMGLLDLCWNYSIGFGSTISEEWHDTDIYGDTLKKGSYIVRAIVTIQNNSEKYIGEYTGIMSWVNNTVSGFTEEIMLNFSGRTKDKLRFFLRTTGRNNENGTTLQFAFDKTVSPTTSSFYADINISFIKIF